MSVNDSFSDNVDEDTSEQTVLHMPMQNIVEHQINIGFSKNNNNVKKYKTNNHKLLIRTEGKNKNQIITTRFYKNNISVKEAYRKPISLNRSNNKRARG